LIEIVHGFSPPTGVTATKKEACASLFSTTLSLRRRAVPWPDWPERKSRLIENGQIGQHLAVDFDVGLLQAIHEGAVLHAFQTGSGIDTGDPQGTELTLALTTVTVLVLTGLHHRLFGDAIYVLATTAVTLGLDENLLVTRARRYTTFDSRHLLSPYA
jgi:hypothetical protein